MKKLKGSLKKQQQKLRSKRSLSEAILSIRQQDENGKGGHFLQVPHKCSEWSAESNYLKLGGAKTHKIKKKRNCTFVLDNDWEGLEGSRD